MQESPPAKTSFRAWRRRRTGPGVLRASGDDGQRLRNRHSSLYIFPNLFTSASLFLALFSLVKTSEGDFTMACWLILAAAVCDAVDGPIARLTRTSSNFGLQFDSLADVVAFGVAPAFLMFHSLKNFDQTFLPNYAPKLALGACALYAICSAIRLARFNTQAYHQEKNKFCGLPTPGAAGVVVSAFLFVGWLNNLPAVAADVDAAWLARVLHRLILVLMVALALLMVSEVPFPKLKSLLNFSRNPINTLVIVSVLICVLITLTNFLPAVLFMGFVCYILGTVLYESWRRVFRRRNTDMAQPRAAV